MLIKNFGKINVVADYYQNSYSWGHWCEIQLENGAYSTREKYRYYNRTRERFTYQSVISGTFEKFKEKLSWSMVEKLADDLKKVEEFLAGNGY